MFGVAAKFGNPPFTQIFSFAVPFDYVFSDIPGKW